MAELDWSAIFARRPDLAPPGYEEAAGLAPKDSELRYERNGRKRAGSSGRSKPSPAQGQGSRRFNGMKHSGTQD
jgi:hypothetical protein